MIQRYAARMCEARAGVREDGRVASPVPLVIAHRGASRAAPEHTMRAYDLAFTMGVDGVECDVRLTADGELVCLHDRALERTSSGRGTVSTHTLAQLRALDFGSWHPCADGPDRVLTLRELVARAVAEPSGPLLCIEAKHPSRFGGLLERQLVEVLREAGLTVGDLPGMPRVRIMSFSVTALHRVRQLAPRVPLVQLIDHGTPRPTFRGALFPGIGTAGVSLEFVRRNPRFVESFTTRGTSVYVWTVNEPEDVRRCRDLGVEAIITDRPGAVIDAMGNGQ